MGLLKDIRGQFLDLTFRLQRGTLKIRIVEKPGLWLPEAECAAIVHDLQTIVRSLGKGDLNYGVVSGDPERLRTTVITLIYDAQTGQPIAFNALPILPCVLKSKPVDVHHLGLVVIDAGVRNKGLSGVLYIFAVALLFLRNHLKPIWISSVTQVPAVFGLVAENFDGVYPSPLPRAHRTFDHVVLARQIMDQHRSAFGVGSDANFDERRFVITNSYTGGSDNLKKPFSAAAPHRNAVFNDECERELDYARGDDFLQLGKLNLSVFLTYFARGFPEGSFLAFASQLGYSVVQQLVFPIIYWFDANHRLGELRPWTTHVTPREPT